MERVKRMDRKFECPRCGEILQSNLCLRCGREVKNTDILKGVVEEYKDCMILHYKDEKGVRVDWGTARSKEVSTVEEARRLIDLRCSPDEWIGDDGEENIMKVEDLIVYLQTLPRGTELFAYGGVGGFYSLDSLDALKAYFKHEESSQSLFIDHVRYLLENEERLSAGMEWSDLISPFPKSSS